jgi:predicted DNA-binding transcriptional regulator YafY
VEYVIKKQLKIILMYPVIKLRDQLLLLHNLIKRRATSTPAELAEKLAVSERTVKSLIAQLRAMGSKIAYSRISCTYYYVTPSEFRFGYECSTSELEEQKKIV